jgi:hypothetical protein
MTAVLTLVCPPLPNGIKEVKKTFGDFKYTELAKGAVDIDDTWEKDNIVMLRNVCKTGCNIQLHRLIAPLFEHCLAEAMKAAPKYKVRMLGGHVPRHKMHDPKRDLSTHTWGIAFDINWDKNPVSSKLITDLPDEFVAAFTGQGWDWGGKWRGTKDSMHFQYAVGC